MKIALLLLFVVLVESEVVPQTVEFSHEICAEETLTSNGFKELHSAEPLFNKHGVLELFVRFKGIADGHIILSSNQNSSDLENRYSISLGSYNNKVSEIRRDKKPEKIEFKINTPSILSTYQYRGFIVRYNPFVGSVSVCAEGSDLPLLHLTDPDPLEIKFFGFATWHNRITQVAFNCRAKDDHSTVTKRISDDDSQTKNINGTKNSGKFHN